ncbi:hypothetical protein D9M68_448190 [compost metagenome]
MKSHARRIGLAPKCPMSAYSASPPVNARNTAPSTASDCARCTTRKPTARRGSSAASTCGCCSTCHSPATPSTRNHSSITGPNILPTTPVPFFCTMNSPTRIASVIGITARCSTGACTSRPSTADSTEIAGVIRLSP